MTHQTIAAIATPPGRGGVAMVRISGPAVVDMMQPLLGKKLSPRQASLCHFLDAHGDSLDQGLALYFPAPHSYTGENVLELHGHGGAVIADLILQRVLQLDARLARPGEFTERAFLNNKLDLAQAEAVADLIDSGSEQAARAALRSLQGEFSALIHALVERLTELRVYVEAALDFPTEEIDFLSDGLVLEKLKHLNAQLQQVLTTASQGVLLKEGMTLLIAGRPNVGKSSLINQLAGYDAAIVTEIAGTTRDLVREHIQIEGLPVHIIDTAGLHDTDDVVEQEGIKRAWQEMHKADRVLLVVDASLGMQAGDQAIREKIPVGLPVDLVFNKIDLCGDDQTEVSTHATAVCISAKTGAGIDQLRQHLLKTMGYKSEQTGLLTARRRHITALEAAVNALSQAEQTLRTQNAGELLAEDLKLAQHALGEITGAISSDDLLGEIFSHFCIGK